MEKNRMFTNTFKFSAIILKTEIIRKNLFWKINCENARQISYMRRKL